MRDAELRGVVYTINEGVKGAIRSIRFEGNAHFSERRAA